MNSRLRQLDLGPFFELSDEMLGVAALHDGSWQRVNPAFATILGWDESDLLSRSLFDLFEPDDVALVQEFFSGAGAQGARTTIVRRTACKDGAGKWVAWDLTAAPAAGCVYCIGRDESGRTAVAERLHQSERRYRDLVQNANSAILRWDADGTLMFFNEFAESLFGYRADEVVGKPVSVLLPREDSTGTDLSRLVADIVAQPMRYEAYVNENICKDGRRIWMLWTNRPLYDRHGNVEGVMAIGSDITARKATEDALRESEAVYRSIARNFPDGAIYVFDHDLRFRVADGEALTLFGGAREDIEGRTLREVATGEVLRLLEQRYLRTLAGEHLRTETATGGRTFSSSYAPIRDGDGQVILGMVVSHDVTERKRIEQALRNADALKDRFLATLAHELRNPLAPIRSGIEILQRVHDPSRQADTLAMMQRQVAHVAHLVDELLDLSRITHGKISLDLQVHDLRETVHQAVRSITVDGTPDSRLDVVLPGHPVLVSCDKVRMFQVVENLLSNARRHTPPDGHIVIRVEAGSDQASLSVRDDGSGIPADELAHIFEFFHQGTAGNPEGLGIGLALVRDLVELHGGTITAASEGPDRGSEFTLTLPMTAALRAAPTLSPDPPTAPAPAMRILVVDDNADAAEALTQLLALSGHVVETAHAGDAALRLVASFAPEVVLLDIGLPDIDGFAVARAIRSRTSAPLLVAVTGWGNRADKERAAEAGFAAHMTKPIDLETLHRLLAGLHDSRRR